MSIRVLSQQLVNQIAAGEVVERPAHMTKELVENALDAGATTVEIDFDEGGRVLSIKDDGSGISKEDLPLVFARHATSKIAHVDDLFSLNTYGFRGEALASLSSVSRIQLVSRTGKEEQAYRIDSEFGEMVGPMEVSGICGTHLRVEALFENLPARLKFLKSEAAEGLQIKNVVKAAALSRPDVRFTLKQKSKRIFDYPAVDSLHARARQVLPETTLFAHTNHFQDIHVELVFSPPHEVLKQNRGLWIFVQNRWVQDKTIGAAVLEAYRSLLMHGEYPVAVVKVSLEPEDVDVNIHPTKSQVKFKQSSTIFRAVYHTLREALEAAPWLKGRASETAEATAEVRVQKAVESFSVRPPVGAEQLAFTHRHAAVPEWSRTQFQEKTFFTSSAEAREPVPEPFNFVQAPQVTDRPSEVAFWRGLHVIGQANLTYIVAQSETALMLVDQHASHERIQYEKLWSQFRAGRVNSQAYLLPLTLDFEEAEVEALETVIEDLKTLGVEIERSGPQSVSVLSKPELINDRALTHAIERLMQELTQNGHSFSFEKVLSEIFSTMACHSSVRAGQALSREQMVELLAQMDEFPLSSFCPHGRPVFVEYHFHELERDFGRLV